MRIKWVKSAYEWRGSMACVSIQNVLPLIYALHNPSVRGINGSSRNAAYVDIIEAS